MDSHSRSERKQNENELREWEGKGRGEEEGLGSFIAAEHLLNCDLDRQTKNE